ncbi:MAG: ABC transporter ATP-binding protein [Bacteroidia bacterium]|nr:ABC transporter ATP-binding protein [Bacteroidia bacterium]
MTAIIIDNLHVAYGRQPVLTGVTTTIPKGKLTAILGENGCGKSTLLNTLCLLNSINNGYVDLFGNPLSSYDHRELSQTISLVGQHTDTLPITVFDYILMGRTPHRALFSIHDTPEDRKITSKLIARLHLEGIKDKTLATISGGERQLASIARAIAQDTPIMLLDEPTANLDIRHQEEIMRLLQQEVAQGKTVVVVMHDINLAARYAEYVIMLKEGIVFKDGNAKDILNSQYLSELYQINFTKISDNNNSIFIPI